MNATMSVEERLEKLAALDFTQIKRKLREKVHGGKGWTQAEADLAEKWYRRFLHLRVKYHSLVMVPNGPIDVFWHQHLLDTRAYARDREEVFGEFLHHNPYFGLNGDADERDAAFEETNRFYRMEFGEDCTGMGSAERGEEMAFAGAGRPEASWDCVPSGGTTCS